MPVNYPRHHRTIFVQMSINQCSELSNVISRAFVHIKTNLVVTYSRSLPAELSLFLQMKLYPSSSIFLIILRLCSLVSEIAILSGCIIKLAKELLACQYIFEDF